MPPLNLLMLFRLTTPRHVSTLHYTHITTQVSTCSAHQLPISLACKLSQIFFFALDDDQLLHFLIISISVLSYVHSPICRSFGQVCSAHLFPCNLILWSGKREPGSHCKRTRFERSICDERLFATALQDANWVLSDYSAYWLLMLMFRNHFMYNNRDASTWTRMQTSTL